MLITNFFIKHPCKTIIAIYGVLFILALLCLKLEILNVNLNGPRDYLILNDEIVVNYDIVSITGKYMRQLNHEDHNIEPIRSTTKGPFSQVILLYTNTQASKIHGLLHQDFLIKI